MTTAQVTPQTVALILAHLWELHERRGTMVMRSRTEHAELRHALTWLGEQQAVSVHEAHAVPYALTRVSTAVRDDAIQMVQKADIRTLQDFAASLGKPIEKPHRGRR
jgi:hypothetical protein